MADEGLLTAGSGESLLSSPAGNGDNRTSAGSEGTPAVTKRENVYGYEKQFSPDDQGHPAFEGIDTPAKLGRSYIELKTQVGKSLAPPGADATDDERYDFLNKAGIETRPKSQDGYVFQNPAGVPEADMGWFKEKAFALGLSQTQANELQAEFRLTQSNANKIKGQNGALEMAREERSLQREWGNPEQVKEKKELANRCLNQFIAGDQDTIKFFEALDWQGQPAIQHPAFRRLFAKIGAATAEGNAPRTNAQNPEGVTGGAQFAHLDKV